MEANRQYGLAEVAVHKSTSKNKTTGEQIAQLEQQTLDWGGNASKTLCPASINRAQTTSSTSSSTSWPNPYTSLDEEYIAAGKPCRFRSRNNTPAYKTPANPVTASRPPPKPPCCNNRKPWSTPNATIKPDRTRQPIWCARRLAKESPSAAGTAASAASPSKSKPFGVWLGTSPPPCANWRRRRTTATTAAKAKTCRQPLPFWRSHRPNRRQTKALQRNPDAVNGKVQTLPHLFGGGEATPQNDRRRFLLSAGYRACDCASARFDPSAFPALFRRAAIKALVAIVSSCHRPQLPVLSSAPVLVFGRTCWCRRHERCWHSALLAVWRDGSRLPPTHFLHSVQKIGMIRREQMVALLPHRVVN